MQNNQQIIRDLVKAFENIVELLTKLIQENYPMAKTMNHSDAKQDKKLINKIVDKKLARVTRADKRTDAKAIKRVVKKPKR